MSPPTRRRVTCGACGKNVAVQGSWPDEYLRTHTDPEQDAPCGGSNIYLLPGEDTNARADHDLARSTSNAGTRQDRAGMVGDRA